jgi:hypothetical protein
VKLFDFFSGLVIDPIPADADEAVVNVYTIAKKALDNHFNPKRNAEFERYTFRSVTQNASETIDAYQARLRTLAKHCEFADTDAEIKSHIILSCRSSRLRRRALTDSTLTLQQLIDLIDLARSMEMSDRQTKAIEGGSHSLMGSADTTVAQIDATKKQQHGPRIRPAEKCRNCGRLLACRWTQKLSCLRYSLSILWKTQPLGEMLSIQFSDRSPSSDDSFITRSSTVGEKFHAECEPESSATTAVSESNG